jgi:hypothetical protein
MDSERWKQVEGVLQSVLDRAPEERDTFLRNVCAGDETLEREVRSLLTWEEQADRFLEKPALEVAAKAMARRESDDANERTDPLIRRTISHYRVVEKLGVYVSPIQLPTGVARNFSAESWRRSKRPRTAERRRPL